MPSKTEMQTSLILNREPGQSPTIIFETGFRPKSQIYRVNQDMFF